MTEEEIVIEESPTEKPKAEEVQTPELTLDEFLKQYGDEFDKADVEKSGDVDIGQFIILYRFLKGQQCKLDEIQRVFLGIDINGKKLISKEEFLQ
jgi:Ca2+-binding EF-hand superfamily protein